MKPKQFDFFDIDKFHLDAEWVAQPKMYLEYAQKLADARADWEKAKAERDLVEAELDHHIRTCPEEYGLEKITEPVVSKAIIRQIRFHDAQNHVFVCKKAMDDFSVIVEALEHRKKALESLVYLHGTGYFAEPKLSPRQERDINERSIERALSPRGKR